MREHARVFLSSLKPLKRKEGGSSFEGTSMRNYCSWCHQADEPSSLPGQSSVQTITKSPTCPQCHRAITLITIRRACEMVSKSKRTMYQWMEKGLVSTVRSSSGTPLVCLSSLFSPSEEEARQHLRERRDELEQSGRKREVS